MTQKGQRIRQSFPRLSFPPQPRGKQWTGMTTNMGASMFSKLFSSLIPPSPPPPPLPTTLQQSTRISYTFINYYISSLTLCPCLCSSETSTSPALSNCSVCRCRQKGYKTGLIFPILTTNTCTSKASFEFSLHYKH